MTLLLTMHHPSFLPLVLFALATAAAGAGAQVPDSPPWFGPRDGALEYRSQYIPAPLAGTTRCANPELARTLAAFYRGPLAARIASGEGRSQSTVGGAASGTLLAGAVGRKVPASEQACVAEVLEFAPKAQGVRWAAGAQRYVVRAAEAQYLQGSYCRAFELELAEGGATVRGKGTACRRPDGVWLAH